MRARLFLGLMAAAPAVAMALAVAPAAVAEPGVTVYPGMEIRQGSTMCTLGFVDPEARAAFTAGHCRGDGPVTDKTGRVIGAMALFDDNTPDGATVTGDHLIADWGAIALADDVQINPVLPGGRALVIDSAHAISQPGQQVCHFGVVTGEKSYAVMLLDLSSGGRQLGRLQIVATSGASRTDAADMAEAMAEALAKWIDDRGGKSD